MGVYSGYLDSIKQQSFQQGYQQGYQLGYQLGLQQSIQRDYQMGFQEVYRENYQQGHIDFCAFVVQHRMTEAGCTPQEALDYLGAKEEAERAAVLAELERESSAAHPARKGKQLNAGGNAT